MKKAIDIRRGNGGDSRIERFEVECDDRATLLDALETIRTGRAPDLAYRHSCHHGSCGTCSVCLDGREVLACLTPLASLGDGVPLVEPLEGFPVVLDLAVDPGRLFRAQVEGAAKLRPSETKAAAEVPAGIDAFLRFEDCIECGCCVSACPVTAGSPEEAFLGPAALAGLRREILVRPEREGELLDRAAAPDGVAACERRLDCSRACPRAVYPGKHIELLRRALAARKPSP